MRPTDDSPPARPRPASEVKAETSEEYSEESEELVAVKEEASPPQPASSYESSSDTELQHDVPPS